MVFINYMKEKERDYCMSDNILYSLDKFNFLNYQNNLGSRCFNHPHFTDEEIKA